MNESKVRILTFSLFHLVAASCIFVILSFVSGCLEKENFKKDRGPQAAGLDVGNAIYDNSPAPDAIKMNEDVYVVTFAKSFTNPEQVVDQGIYKVIKFDQKEETSNNQTIKYNEIDFKYSDFDSIGTLEQTRESTCDLITSPIVGWAPPECPIFIPPFQNSLYQLLESNSLDTNALRSINPIEFFAKKVSPKPIKPNNVTFYDLKSYDVVKSLPSIVIKENRCGKFVDCKIKLKYLEFDQVDGITGERVHFKLGFSKELPYLASNFEKCYNYIKDGVPLEQCMRVLDFNYGE